MKIDEREQLLAQNLATIYAQMWQLSQQALVIQAKLQELREVKRTLEMGKAEEPQKKKTTK